MKLGAGAQTHKSHRWLRGFIVIGSVLILIAIVVVIYELFLAKSPIVGVQFDSTVSPSEKSLLEPFLAGERGTVSIETRAQLSRTEGILEAYVPITNKYSPRQEIKSNDLTDVKVYVLKGTEPVVWRAIADTLGITNTKLQTVTLTQDLRDGEVVFAPISKLSPAVKLLRFDDTYYLDSFTSGAIFRQAVLNSNTPISLQARNLPAKKNTLKVNMTGVTAITRKMIAELSQVGDPKYFSEKIDSFLADADITHISNEVSFKPGCGISNTVFCAPPQTIETLKASGVDVVELTGNHNNDVGSDFNTSTIEQYHELGWGTFGGGINATEAAKPYIVNKKGTRLAFLGYNYFDSPSGGAIATDVRAGANSFDFEKIKADIASVKKQADFVIVDVQYKECYAYPAFGQEYPACYRPITNQTEDFRHIADLGADVVIGTQAHQPQTYELYNGVPIYYGLGNLYFDQIEWPGTKQSIVLTHYLIRGGKLLQTKLTPTVYDTALQVDRMSDSDATRFLQDLAAART